MEASVSVSVMVSGGFDPLHGGHLEYISRAAQLGKVIVALNSDEWLIRKKGYVFMSWDERAKILQSLKYVDRVVPVDDTDGSVNQAIREHKPTIFANGGDRSPENAPETVLCREMGIGTLFNLGAKVQSSSGLVNRVKTVQRLWGSYDVLWESPKLKVKLMKILPGRATSEQVHDFRQEWWFWEDGGQPTHVPAGKVHQLANETDDILQVIEVQIGTCEEDDIRRKAG